MADLDDVRAHDGSVPAQDEFRERARLVESRPLEERAAAYAQLHDELRTRLEGGGGASA